MKVRDAFKNIKYFPFLKQAIGYMGWLEHGNLGDEAMYLSFLRIFSGHKVLPFKRTERTDRVEKIIGKPIYNSCCLGGGTLINSFGEIATVKSAIERYKNFFIFGSGVRNPEYWEKFHNENYLKEWVQILSNVKFVGVRGPISKRILDSLGVSNVEVIGDPALFLSKDELRKKERSGRVGINFGLANGQLWGSEASVQQFAIDLVRELQKNYKEIVFFPVSFIDLPYIRKIVEVVGLDPKKSILRDFLNLDHFMKELSGCDFFIGEKLHSVILANSLHIPSIMLEYRPKCRDFMASMDMSDFNFKTDELEVEKVILALGILSRNRDVYREKIFMRTKYYKNRLVSAKEKIIKLIGI